MNANAQAPALTARERDVLLMAALGNSNKHIARRINVSVRTVESHRTQLRRKLGVGTLGRLEAMFTVVLSHEVDRVAKLLGVDTETVEHQRLALRRALG